MTKISGINEFTKNALKYGFSLWGLPKTGYHFELRPNDDGDLQTGYPLTGPRFADNGDGSVTDNATGLMWLQDPSQLGGIWGTPGSPAPLSWNDAIDNSALVSLGGFTDWRLPNIKEIFSINDWGKFAVSIDESFFFNTAVEYYWSSTSELFFTDSAFAVFFQGGYTYSMDKSEPHFARPVRGF